MDHGLCLALRKQVRTVDSQSTYTVNLDSKQRVFVWDVGHSNNSMQDSP